MQPRIGGAAAAGQERRTGQFAATGQVQHRAVLRVHRVRPELHLRFAADAAVVHGRAVVVVGQAVHGAAIGHHQAVGTDRGDAARQQVDHAGIAAAIGAAQGDVAQRRTQNTALVEGGCSERHVAEHAVGLRRQGGADALDVQYAVGIEVGSQRTPLVHHAAQTNGDVAAAVDLRGGQRGVAGRVQIGTAQAQVALAFDAHAAERIAGDHQRIDRVLHDLAIGTEADHAHHVDQVAGQGDGGRLGQRRHTQRTRGRAEVARTGNRIGHQRVV
ncbi:hypothetical protein D3C72_987620 [compost metagenome]